jgi:hypothetical protein
MSRLVRIGEKMVELSGLRSIWLGADHLCRSRITLFYPNRPSNKDTETIQYEYGNWAQAEKDKKVLEEAVASSVLKH